MRNNRMLQEEDPVLVYQLRKAVIFTFLARFNFEVCQYIESSAIPNSTDIRKFSLAVSAHSLLILCGVDSIFCSAGLTTESSMAS